MHATITGHPLLPRFTRGGNKKATLAEFAQRIRKECDSGAIPTLHNPGARLWSTFAERESTMGVAPGSCEW